MDIIANAQSREMKRSLIRGVHTSVHSLSLRFPYQVHLNIHDIPFEFHVTNEDIIKQLYDHYPLCWFGKTSQEPFKVFWVNSRSLSIDDETWEDDAQFECSIYQEADLEIAVQRDFAGSYTQNTAHLICPYSLADGFFNFLRWIAPVRFLNDNKLLLHSSCVLDSKKQAHFALGQSGAGKSTIASLMPRNRVLGDDMNVLKIQNGSCWAQAGALGQSIMNPKEYSHWYPVSSFLWLKKAYTLSLKPMDRSTQVKNLTTSVANVFWQSLDKKQTLKIFQLVTEILKYNTMYQLSFPIRQDLWRDIFEEMDAQKRSQGGGD